MNATCLEPVNSTVQLEGRRQGQRARRRRSQLDPQATTPKPQLELTLEPYPMII
jgi:hypothetical protein